MQEKEQNFRFHSHNVPFGEIIKIVKKEERDKIIEARRESIIKELGLEIEPLFYKFSTYYQIMPWNIWSRPAVYYFFDVEYEFLYIGQTKTLRKRIISHNTARHKSEPWMKHVEYITYNYCDKDLLREIEKKEILKYEPIFNKAICGETHEKKTHFKFGTLQSS